MKKIRIEGSRKYVSKHWVYIFFYNQWRLKEVIIVPEFSGSKIKLQYAFFVYFSRYWHFNVIHFGKFKI
jgi:hypothetical protein